MATPVAEAADVTFSYDSEPAVDGVSFSLPAGTAAALLGPNGAGKTTFIRLLTGILTPDDGSVRLFGGDLTEADRARLGVLPQGFTPQARLTPRELLKYYGGLYPESRSVTTVLEELGIESAADRQYRRLSGGQQRRTCLGIALINRPRFLVLDEPTAGIDPGGKRALWRYLPKLVDAGTTLLVTTHDMVEAERLADRIGFFHQGELLAFDTAEALVEEYLGQRHLIIETSAPAHIAERLKAASMTDDAVRVEGVTQSELGGLVDQVLDVGVEVSALRWEQPPLEELFTTMIDGGEGT